MNTKEFEKRQESPEDRLIRRYMEKIEAGDEVIIKRIHSSLLIDSLTKPSFDEIREYVTILKLRHARSRK